MTTIRLVDDNPADNFVLRLNINRLGLDWKVSTYTDAKQVLFELRRSPADHPELLLVDIHMPGMDGFEFVDAFSKLSHTARRHRTVCIASGSNDPDDRRRAAAHPHITTFLAKPVDPMQLVNLTTQHAAS